MSKAKCLRTLRVNQKACVRAIEASGELGRRIRDLGIIPGTEVFVVGRAPLRDPVSLRLRDFTLIMRNNEADHIMVDTEE